MTNLAYPLADLLLVGFLVLGVAVDGWRVSRSQLLVAAALGVLLVSDTAFLFRIAAGTFTQNTVLDASWSGALVLLGSPPGSRTAPTGRHACAAGSRWRRHRSSRCSPSAC